VRILDLATRQVIDTIPETSGSVEWGADDSTFFYLKVCLYRYKTFLSTPLNARYNALHQLTNPPPFAIMTILTTCRTTALCPSDG